MYLFKRYNVDCLISSSILNFGIILLITSTLFAEEKLYHQIPKQNEVFGRQKAVVAANSLAPLYFLWCAHNGEMVNLENEEKQITFYMIGMTKNRGDYPG